MKLTYIQQSGSPPVGDGGISNASIDIQTAISILFGVSVSPILFNTPCALRCCAQHDSCYCTNCCHASSWFRTILKALCCSVGIKHCCAYMPCQQCNVNAVKCIYNYITKRHHPRRRAASRQPQVTGPKFRFLPSCHVCFSI